MEHVHVVSRSSRDNEHAYKAPASTLNIEAATLEVRHLDAQLPMSRVNRQTHGLLEIYL